VNEAVDVSTASGYRESVFYQTLGEGYIADAFRWARAADPDVLLFYNEIGIERLGAKSDFTYAMLSDLLESGVPIDGIGLQSHVSTHRYPSEADSARQHPPLCRSRSDREHQ
jgi:endo-1,4-beta-xylanase